LHGALNSESAAPDGSKRKSLFYIRNCDLSSKYKHREFSKIFLAADYPDRLQTLVNKVKRSGFPCKEYSQVKKLAETILEDVKEAIDLDFPLGTFDPLEMENQAHETYAEIRSRVYISRSEYYSAIDRYIVDDSAKPLVITGGKLVVMTWALQ
jgi:hypothetical protein